MWFERLLFPQRCISCRKYWGSYVCDRCFLKIPFCKIQYCSHAHCNKPAINGEVHDKCIRRNGLDGHISVTQYQGVMKHVMEFYKRRGVYRLEDQIKQIFESYFHEDEESTLCTLDNPIVIPVPLFKYERWLRPYSVSERLAQIFSTHMGFIYDQYALQKVLPTFPQKDLSRKERLTNLDNTFVISESKSIYYKDIVLVDDVWTTGATLRECAKTLKKAGAMHVWAVTLCRGI